jgi:phosphate transport system permease protein
VSTLVFDESTVTTLQQQSAQKPWDAKTGNWKAAVALAVIVPFVITMALLLFTDIPKALVMVVEYLPLQLIAAAVAATATRGRKNALDAVIIVFAIGATVFALVVLVSVIMAIITKGIPVLSGAFVSQNMVYISPSTPLGYGGIGHAVIGTILIVVISAVIAVPLGVATAVYVTEVRGKAVPYVRFFIQAMSGVPSVVAGLFILTVFILTGVLKTSALCGALAYAILMLPTVARTAEEVLKLVPEDLRTGALALGSTRARVVLQVVIPAAKTGIITAAILGLARVVGETAPLLMTVGYTDKTVINPLTEPITALPAFIFSYVSSPYPDAVSRAWGAALVLMILVSVLFITTRILTSRRPGR